MPLATFPPAARLHRPCEFAAALKGQRLARGALFVLIAAPVPLSITPPSARLGLIVPKRLAARAVTRNTIKRVVRESFRHSRLSLPPRDYVMRLNTKIAVCSTKELKKIVRAEADAHFRRAMQC